MASGKSETVVATGATGAPRVVHRPEDRAGPDLAAVARAGIDVTYLRRRAAPTEHRPGLGRRSPFSHPARSPDQTDEPSDAHRRRSRRVEAGPSAGPDLPGSPLGSREPCAAGPALRDAHRVDDLTPAPVLVTSPARAGSRRPGCRSGPIRAGRRTGPPSRGAAVPPWLHRRARRSRAEPLASMCSRGAVAWFAGRSGQPTELRIVQQSCDCWPCRTTVPCARAHGTVDGSSGLRHAQPGPLRSRSRGQPARLRR